MIGLLAIITIGFSADSRVSPVNCVTLNLASRVHGGRITTSDQFTAVAQDYLEIMCSIH